MSDHLAAHNFPAVSLLVTSIPDGKSFTIAHNAIPQTFDAFIEQIVRNFKKSLPQKFYLEYEDTDGDKVMLTTEDDYYTMFSFRDEDGAVNSIKIMINEAKIPDDNDKVITLSEHLQQILDEPEPEVKQQPEQVASGDAKDPIQAADEHQNRANPVNKKPEIDDIEEPEETVIIRMKSSAEVAVDSERKAEISSIQRTVTERKVQAITLKLMKTYLNEVTWKTAQKISEEVPDIKIPKSRLENMLYLAKIASGNAKIPKPAEIKPKSDEELIKQSIKNPYAPTKKEDPADDSNMFASDQGEKPDPVIRDEYIKPKPMPVDQPKIQQPIIYQDDPNSLYNAAFKQHIGTIPHEPQETDSYIYSTVALFNNGKKAWPQRTTIVSCCDLKGESVSVPEIAPGQHFTCVLITKNPGKAENYTAVWGFKYQTNAGQTQSFGSPIIIEFTVKKSGGQVMKRK